MVIPEYHWMLTVTYLNGNKLDLPFFSFHEAETFACGDKNIMMYVIEAIK